MTLGDELNYHIELVEGRIERLEKSIEDGFDYSAGLIDGKLSAHKDWLFALKELKKAKK